MKKLKSIVLTTVILLYILQVSEAQNIFEVIKSNDLQEVQRLVSNNRQLVDSLDEKGNTPLLSAIGQKNVEISKYLIANGSNLNLKNKSGNTPLHVASYVNLQDIVNLLLEKGAEVNAENQYQLTPLFFAIESKNPDVARILLEHGADVNFCSPVFGCPIHRVIYADSPDLLNLLLAKGVNIEVTDADGKTALHLTGMLGRLELANILIESGANLNVKDSKGFTPLHWAILYGQDRNGKSNSSELSKLLVGKGAYVTTMTEEGVTPVYSAAANGYTDIVVLLHKNGGDIHWISKENSRTLLHIACMKGYGDLADYLLSQGVDKKLKDSEGRTACDYALKFGNDKIALRLSGDSEVLKKSERASKYLLSEKGHDKACIWLMNNRGWTVFTGDHLFIFDNEENGRIPDQPSLSNGWVSTQEIRDQNIIALYSGYHAIPGSMEFIHAKEDSLKNIIYFNYTGDKWRGGKNTRYISGREIQKTDNVEIVPYETHDAYGMGSLGYLVKTKSVTFFYPNFFPEDASLLQKEVDFLAEKCHSIDFAIIEITQGTENVSASYIIEKLKPKMVIPYDRSGKTESYIAFRKEMANKYPSIQVLYAIDPGERIYFKK